MKSIAFFSLLCIAIIACKKSNSLLIQPGKITGMWELRLTSGSIAGTVKYSPGNGNIREFSGDSAFRFINPGLPDLTGTYTLQKAGSGENWLLLLRYITGTQPRSITDSIHFENNHTLVFLASLPCCDIPSDTYVLLP